jgi:predicted RNA-binding protein with PUA-like domain
MKRWLVKSDPQEYSADHLAEDKQTIWDGVSNPLAQKHLREMSKGDPVLIYHTGNERAVVALAHVAVGPKPDPDDASGKIAVVTIAFDKRLASPVTLADIKAEPAFASFDLVRLGRLSILPVSAGHWNRLMKMAGEA